MPVHAFGMHRSLAGGFALPAFFASLKLIFRLFLAMSQFRGITRNIQGGRLLMRLLIRKPGRFYKFEQADGCTANSGESAQHKQPVRAFFFVFGCRKHGFRGFIESARQYETVNAEVIDVVLHHREEAYPQGFRQAHFHSGRAQSAGDAG
ncbi:MAG: hypothetical protein AB1717_09845 [Pseudomonadota bacterium]